jgi:isopenicillin N synthase-like dioxygenase
MSIAPVSLDLFAADFRRFSDDLGGAFERYGFAVLSDTQIDPQLIENALDATKAFFALPESVKRRYVVPGAQHQRGYTPFGVETAKGEIHSDLKEFWHTGRELPPGHPYRAFMADNVWPAEIPVFHDAVLGLYDALEALGLKVLSALARRLGLADDYFESAVRLGDSVLRLLHYPPLRGEGPRVRAAAHEDINTITLLLGADEAGLEIRDADGTWIPVNPPPGAVVCNIGDMLQRLTNGVLPSTTHRVVNPLLERRGLSRYSAPFFLHFAPDLLIQTLPSCVTEARPNLYPTPITAQDYLAERLREIKLAAI